MTQRPSNSLVILLLVTALLFVSFIAVLLKWVIPALQPEPVVIYAPTWTAAPQTTPGLSSNNGSSQSTPAVKPTLPPEAVQEGLSKQGLILLSMADGEHYHLFAYHPQYLPVTRLTDGPWDDLQPSVSPDGSKVAFTSNRNGYWDLFLLELSTGKQTRLTDTPEYDGSPTWSPDGKFLAHETYTDTGTQIFISQLADPDKSRVQLTDEPGQAFAPAWSPKGREIAFVSTTSGQEDIWIARLDRIDDRFIQVSQSGSGRDHAPRWSPDGNFMAWATDTSGTSILQVWDARTPERPARTLANGDTPVWSPDGKYLLSEIDGPNQVSLAVYWLSDGVFLYPPNRMPGRMEGLDWRSGAVPGYILAFPYPANSRQEAKPLFQEALTGNKDLIKGRFSMVSLAGISAPYPYLHDSVNESFEALRKISSERLGWDFLGTLENAYLPITTPSQPGLQENWLYTGRAIAVNSLPMNAGWLALSREDIGGQTYWRVYVRCLFQDGSQGRPIRERLWDLNARYKGDPRTYDQGGDYGSIPAGYWVDFTDLAARYGWERLPAQITWRTYYPATLFNLFVMRQGFTWQAAMSQIYPSEAISTPTPWVTLTSTVTMTPTMYYQHLITPSLTPTITNTPTRRPTLTPPSP